MEGRALALRLVEQEALPVLEAYIREGLVQLLTPVRVEGLIRWLALSHRAEQEVVGAVEL